MSQNTDIVLDFCHCFSDFDIDKVMGFFTADCIYHNIPMEPAVGTDAIRGTLSALTGLASESEWVVHQIAENADGAVLTERTDKFLINDKWVEVPVMGVFELSDGKIRAWRDYFDLAQFQSQFA